MKRPKRRKGWNGNLLEVMYNITDDGVDNVFHAMKCCKKYRDLIER